MLQKASPPWGDKHGVKGFLILRCQHVSLLGWGAKSWNVLLLLLLFVCLIFGGYFWTAPPLLFNKLLIRAGCALAGWRDWDSCRGWKLAHCSKSSSLPEGSSACSESLFGAREEGDGRLRGERDGRLEQIVSNEPCWKHCQKQRAGSAGLQEQRSAGCLLFAHRGTLLF